VKNNGKGDFTKERYVIFFERKTSTYGSHKRL